MGKRKASGEQKSSNKRRKKKLKMPVFVVDEHNDAMLPFLDAIKSKKLPTGGVKMLHYDSHPDLGNIPKESKFVKNTAKGKVDKKGLHKLTDIATWITPLALAGHLTDVIWVAGHWCHQIDEGSYELACGIDKKDGKLKTASADGNNEDNEAVTDYWDCDGTAAPLKNLKDVKTWTLHVFKHNKKGALPDDSFYAIQEIIGDSPWVLDIDEDFFSCNNPHRDDFSACFGHQAWLMMKKIYDIGSPWDTELEKILQKKLFLKKETTFLKAKPTKKVIEALNDDGTDGLLYMKKFHKFLHGQFKKEYEEGVNIEELFALDDIHVAGLYSGLPHHLTRAEDIVEMGNGVEEVLNEFKKHNNPVHVTLATSRADRYLPDCQASIIHAMLEQMMEAIYDKGVTVTRMDKPEFSICFADETDEEN